MSSTILTTSAYDSVGPSATRLVAPAPPATAAVASHATPLENMTPPHESDQIDIRIYASALWRRRWPILAVLIIVPAIAYVLSARNRNTYEASALIQVRLPLDAALGGPTIEQTTAIAARLVQTRSVSRSAQRRLRSGGPLDPLSVNPDPTTGFITLTASGRSPRHAAAVANTYAEAAVAITTSQAAQQLDAGIHETLAQLATVSRTNTLARSRLQQRVIELRAARAATPTGAQIVQRPSVPSAPSSPKPLRAALLGLVIAILLALLLTVLAEGADRRIRDAQGLEEISSLPLLSAVPRSAFAGPPFRPAVDESFARLRASLSYFSIDRSISSVMVVSPGAEEGKTLTSINLAIAYAHEGKDVVLLEADLRRPRIAERLGVDSARNFRDALVGDIDLAEVLITVPLEAAGSGRLRVLVAGPPPPNPAELLSSNAFVQFLQRLVALCDVVVVDTSPLMAVSDAIPLLQQMSGIVLLAKLNSTSRDQLRRAESVVRATGAALLGVVATGAPDRDPYIYSEYLPRGPSVTSSNGDGRANRRSLRALGRGRRA